MEYVPENLCQGATTDQSRSDAEVVLGIQGDSEELHNQQLVLSFKILVVDK